MNEAQVSTVQLMRQVLLGTQALQFRPAEDDVGRYAWIDAVLRRLDYRQLGRSERGVVRAYLRQFSGYSRAQIARLVSRWMAREPLVTAPCTSTASTASSWTRPASRSTAGRGAPRPTVLTENRPGI